MHFPRNSMPLAHRNHYGKLEIVCIMLTTISSGLCRGKQGMKLAGECSPACMALHTAEQPCRDEPTKLSSSWAPCEL